MNRPVQESLAAVKQCQGEVHQLLSEPNVAIVRHEINRLFERIITRLSFSSGVLEPEAVENGNGHAKKYGPITHIKGKPIKRLDVSLNDLVPEQADIEALRKRTQQLYDGILKMKNSDVLSSYKTNHDQTVLRAVAKWAGIEDYETAPLTEPFIQNIKNAIIKKNKDQKDQKQFKDNLDRKQVKVGEDSPQNDTTDNQ